jgi:RNA polymerase sigma-70 factor (ECF subfamily)
VIFSVLVGVAVMRSVRFEPTEMAGARTRKSSYAESHGFLTGFLNSTHSQTPEPGTRKRHPKTRMDAQEHNDWELMQRVAASDEAAIDELYRRFGALVYQSARQVLRSRAETEDAVQEVFVRLWKTADRFDPHRAKLVTWVMLISRRHLIDRLRRQSARPDRAELDTSRTDAGGAVARPEAEGRIEGEEGRERLRRQLARLPELQRSVIERAYLQGFSLREIAEQLNSPLGTVKSALSRGLTRLRELEGAREERG